MNIAIDISPISEKKGSSHKIRGVGYYIQHLKKELIKNPMGNTFSFIEDTRSIPNTSALLHIPYFDPFFAHLPTIKKMKTVITVHDLTPLVFPEGFPVGIRGKIKWNIQKFLLQQTDAIIADSEASKEDIIRITGYPSDKITVVYLAADASFMPLSMSANEKQEMKHKYHLPDKFLLYVGDVTWNKNLPRIIEASNKEKIPLVLVGKALNEVNYDKNNKWNKDLNTVHRLIRNSSNTRRLGFIPTEDLIKLYNLACGTLLPSLYEGFGLTAVEAMQSGCPVITSDRGSLPEVVGDAAIVVNPDSIESIIHGMNEVFLHQKAQDKLSEMGLQQAKKFSWEKTARETIQVYEKIFT